MKRQVKIVVLWFAALTVGSLSAQAQSCPTQWADVEVFYGTFTLKGSGSDSSGATKQQITGGLYAPQIASCIWNAQGKSQMNDLIVLKDTSPCKGGPAVVTANGPGTNSIFTLEIDALAPNSYFTLPSGDVMATCSLCGSPPYSCTTLWGWNGSEIPTAALPASAVILKGSSQFQNPPWGWGTAATDWTYEWNLSPVPDQDCDPCKDKMQGLFGSEISGRNQSLGEDISIVGTPFSLHYESDRQAGRAGADEVAVVDALQLGGWTLNVHHALQPLIMTWCIGGLCTPYATVPKALYLGNGETRTDADVQAAFLLNGKDYLTSEDGNEVFEFDGSTGRHTRTLRPMTGAVRYTFGYDALGYLISVTDASGNVTAIQRDAEQNPTAIVAPFGQKTTLVVDANRYLSQVIDPLGRVTKLSYSSTGLLASLTDPKGQVYSYRYDTYGQLTRHSDPAGGFISLARTVGTNTYSVSEKSAMGVTNGYKAVFSNSSTSTTEQYTDTWPNGLQAKESRTQRSGQISQNLSLPDGSSYRDTLTGDPRWGIQVPIDNGSTITLGSLTMNVTSTRTAALGKAGEPFSLTSQTDTDTVNGRKYTSVFTASSRTYVDTSPAGRKATTVQDSLERISTVQLGTLTPTQYAYDSHGRLSTATQGLRKTTFSYNANGFLASVTDPLGLTNSFTYDADGHVLTATLGDGRVVKFAYDPNNNLTTLIPPGKTAHTLAYNVVNFPSSYTPPAATSSDTTTYSYDKDQNLTTVTRPDAKTIKFNYDTAGRLSSILAPTETINYVYSATTGDLTGASIPTGESLVYGYNGSVPTSSTWSGAVAGSVSRTYNNNFWVALLSVNGAHTITYDYDNDGLLTKAGAMVITRDLNNGLITGTSLGSVTDTRTYNSFGELTRYTAKYNTTTLYAVAYTRDADGRIASKAETINGRTTTYAFTYDNAGRLTGVTQNGTSLSKYTYDTNSNRLSAITSSGTVNGTYDAQDRLLTYGTSSFTYTANGELASEKKGAQTTQYQYDVLGNLISETLPDGMKITYLVDAENHRVAKRVNGTQQTGFLYDGDQIVAELNVSNQIVSQFVYATSSTSPDYVVQGGLFYRIIADQLGSPRLVVNTVTGAVAEQMNYDEFGNVLQDSNAGFQPFGFAGGLKDPYTGFIRFGARDYNPSTGRWAAKDPSLFSGGDTELYGYVLNDPINLTDADGLGGPVWIINNKANAQNYVSPDDTFTVIAHGYPGELTGTKLTPEQVAQGIKDRMGLDRNQIKKIRLVICRAAKGGKRGTNHEKSVQERISKEFNQDSPPHPFVPVEAPETRVGIDSQGNLVTVDRADHPVGPAVLK